MTDPGINVQDLEAVLVSYRSRYYLEELLTMWPAELAVAVVDNPGNVDRLQEFVEGLAHVRPLRRWQGLRPRREPGRVHEREAVRRLRQPRLPPRPRSTAATGEGPRR